MDLYAYWRIVRRRWWIIIVLLAVVSLSYPLMHSPPPERYVANMRFVVGVEPELTPADVYSYDRYYTWLTAEYLLDDLAEVVKSQAFAQDVAALSQISVPAGAIQAATSAGKLHRILQVSTSWHNAQELEKIANAVVQTLQLHSADYFAQLSTESAVISVIDPPSIYKAAPSLRERLDLPLRLILAVGFGILLAFALDALDRTVRDRRDAERLGLPLLAEIPNSRGWWSRLWHGPGMR